MRRRILVDLSYLRSPGEVGGSEDVALGILEELIRRGHRERLLCVANRVGRQTLLRRGIDTDVTISLARPGFLRWPTAAALTLWAGMTRRANRALWLGGLAFPPLLSRSTLLIHDIGPIATPHYPGLRTAVLRTALPCMARRVRHVVTISEYCCRELVEKLGVEESRIHVVHQPVSKRFLEAEPNCPAGLNPGEPFLFCLDDGKPHKNVGTLVRLYSRHRLDILSDFRLVIAGRASRRWRHTGVEGIGYVSLSELKHLYSRSAAVIVPSLYEGFGRPVLEALAAGASVACSNRGALPETGGEFVQVFDPEDEADMLRAIRIAASLRPLQPARLSVQTAWACRHSWAGVGDVMEQLLFNGS